MAASERRRSGGFSPWKRKTVSLKIVLPRICPYGVGKSTQVRVQADPKAMGTTATYQAPMRLDGVRKRESRSQFAALPFRRKKSGTEVLLLTSLDSKRWVLPKGWPMDGKTPAQAAAQEAWEEAGIRGVVNELCAGFYSYNKRMPDGSHMPCIVAVFPLEVRKLHKEFPEAGLRKLKWMPLRKAATRVKEPDLRKIIRNFDPRLYV